MTQPTLERFLDDVKHHELTIHQNNGVDRHLTLEKSGGCYHSFKITTFPHYLVITGNMGALIFSQSHYEYIWLCYAIVWGIKKFDEVTKLKTKELGKEHALARERLKKKQKEEQAEMDKARELAWKDVQIACGHHKMNLTVGEICNDYGFFMQGWSYAIRYCTHKKII